MDEFTENTFNIAFASNDHQGVRNPLFELANLLRHEVHSIPAYHSHSALKQDLGQIQMETEHG